MSSDSSITLRSSHTYATATSSLDEAIQEFLGLGLAYKAWRQEIERRNHKWYPGLEKVIKKKEYEYFKDEIRFLLQEPNVMQSSRVKSNSRKSILKRLKGEVWMEGHPSEREERYRNRRLLSIDAKDRCLDNYVQRWDAAARLPSHTIVGGVTHNPDVESTEQYSSDEILSTADIGNPLYHPGTREAQDSPIRELGPTPNPPHDSVMTTNEMFPTYDYAPHNSIVNGVSFSYADPFWSEDPDPLQAAQNASPFPGPVRMSDISPAALQPSLNHDAATTVFGTFQPGYGDIPAGTVNYSESTHSLEAEPNALTWLDTNPVMEEISGLSQRTLTFADNPPSNGDFVDRNKDIAVDPNENEEGPTSDALRSQIRRASQGPRLPSDSTSISRGQRNVRKRRRGNTFGTSRDMSECSNPIENRGVDNVSLDVNMTMSDCDNTSLPPKIQVRYRLPPSSPPSCPLPTLPCSARSRAAKADSNHQRVKTDLTIKLRGELREEKEDHEKTKNELELMTKKYQAAEAELMELREQINERIIKEADLRKKSISDISTLVTGDEGGHNPKPFRSFPSSRNPRPLSLIPAASSIGNTIPLSCSPTFPENSAILRLPIIPIATGRVSRAGSTASLAIRSITSGGSSQAQCSSPVDSEHSAATSTSPRPTSRSNRSRSADSVTPRPVATVNESSTKLRSRPVTPKNNSTTLTPVSTCCPRKSSDSMDILEALNAIPDPDSLAAPSVSSITTREPSPIKHLMRKISDGFMRKPYREEDRNQVPPVPTVPTSVIVAPVRRQFSETHRGGDKRLTHDSGYASSNFETSSRASIADTN